jgi:superfamily I DNA/RNA helicase
MGLTANQQQAILHQDGNLQLIACAGSGKTEVVARRIAELLKTGETKPANIVAFTFTDKAAAELKERTITRCREALGDVRGLAEMYVGTIHAGCSVVAGLDMYRDLLDHTSFFDYSAIMEAAVDVLTNEPALRQRLKDRIKHVIVDEYQDVNPIQEAIVWSLHELGAQVCVVGDDDQTIYQWRGSDVENILKFQTRYPKVTQLRLEENFRSSEGIVETAGPFIEQNTVRLPKSMQPTTAQAYEAGDIVALAFNTPDEEAL